MPETFADAASTAPGGDGIWTSPMHDAYQLWGGRFIHGGYAMAVAADAMARAADRPDPVTVTGHFLEQVKLQPTQIHAEVIRQGRHATVAGSLRQDGVEKVRLIGTFGATSEATGPSHHGPPPACPPWDDCVGSGFPEQFERHAVIRVDPARAGFMQGKPTGSTVVAGRLRMRQDERIAGPLLVMMSDVLMSPAVEIGIAGMQWIPTVELTVHVHDSSYTGEVLAIIRSEQISKGYATEDVELWSGDGTQLLAMARQLALVRKPA